MHYETDPDGRRLLVQSFREARDHDGNAPPWTDPIPRMIRHANADGLAMRAWWEDRLERRYVGLVAPLEPETSR